MSTATLQIDPESLAPIIEAAIERTLARFNAANAALPEKLCYSEAEAARMLELNHHQLRDERRRGRIKASRIVGRQVRYLRDDLQDYLLRHREGDASRAA